MRRHIHEVYSVVYPINTTNYFTVIFEKGHWDIFKNEEPSSTVTGRLRKNIKKKVSSFRKGENLKGIELVNYSLANLEQKLCSTEAVAACLDEIPPYPTPRLIPEETKGKNMRYYDEQNDCYLEALPQITESTQARDYLTKRVHEIFNNKSEELRPVFFMEDDARPKTVKEMLARIAEGKFIAPDEKVDKELSEESWRYGNPWNHIKWRDPSKPADKKGFKAAHEKLETALAEAQDIIKVSDPTKGLETLNAFKSQTFH